MFQSAKIELWAWSLNENTGRKLTGLAINSYGFDDLNSSTMIMI